MVTKLTTISILTGRIKSQTLIIREAEKNIDELLAEIRKVERVQYLEEVEQVP